MLVRRRVAGRKRVTIAEPSRADGEAREWNGSPWRLTLLSAPRRRPSLTVTLLPTAAAGRASSPRATALRVQTLTPETTAFLPAVRLVSESHVPRRVQRALFGRSAAGGVCRSFRQGDDGDGGGFGADDLGVTLGADVTMTPHRP